MEEIYLSEEDIREMSLVRKTLETLSPKILKEIKEEVLNDAYYEEFCREHNIDYLNIREKDMCKIYETVLAEHHIPLAS